MWFSAGYRPGHVCLKGNIAARQTTSNVMTQILPIPYLNIFPTLRSIIFSKWQAIWDSNPNIKKLYKVFPKLQHFSPLHQSYTRKDQTILNRLFIDQTPLTHSYLLNKEQPPTCDHCKCLLTVEHILTKCTVYKQIREKYYQHSQHSHILISASKQYIFNLLNEIKLLNKL